MKKKVLVAAVVAFVVIIVFTAFQLKTISRRNGQYRQLILKYEDIAQNERQWLLSNQLPDGAFLLYDKEENNTNTIQPYFSNIACDSLLYGEPAEAELAAVRSYIEWYLQHLNTEETDPVNGAGTIYDYKAVTAEDGSVMAESKGKYDSVDSYAATFLILVAHYVQVSKDISWLDGYQTEISSIMDAMLRCMTKEGITYAKKEYPIYYLMDNCEVNAGLRAAAALKNRGIGEDTFATAEEFERYQQNNTDQILNSFWVEDGQYYGTGFDEEGNPLAFSDPPRFYPELVEQIYPLVWGVSEGDSDYARMAYDNLCRRQPWEHMQYKEDGDTAFNWTVLSYAGALMGDVESVDAFLSSYQNETVKGRSYPAYIDDAGWIIRTCEFMKNYYEGKIIHIFPDER